MLKFAIVGTSKIAELMCDAISETDGVESSFVCSRKVETGKAFAERMNIPEYGTFEEIPDYIDAVYIATPNSLHVPQGVAALKMGKHVLLEKPASTTAEGIEYLHNTANENNVFFMEAITTIFMPNLKKIKEHLPEIGKINSAFINFGRYSSKYDAYLRGEKPSNLSYELSGGALNDMGVYCVHTAVKLFGTPKNVCYVPECDETGVDLSGRLYLEYSDFVCNIETSKSRNLDCGIEICGERGTIKSVGEVNSVPEARIISETAECNISVCQAKNRMVYEVEAFRELILSSNKDFFEEMSLQSKLTAKILEKAHKQEDCI